MPQSTADRIGNLHRANAVRSTCPACGQFMLAPDTTIGELTIDRTHHRVTVGERQVKLTNNEYKLLSLLTSEPTRVFTCPEILRVALGWVHPEDVRTRTINTHASRLRRKLKTAGFGDAIVNVWGVGYCFWEREASA